MKTLKKLKVTLFIMFLSLSFQTFAQNFTFHIEIANKKDIPTIAEMRNDGTIYLVSNNEEVGSILENYNIYKFEQSHTTARTPFLQRIYTFEVNDLQMLYDLKDRFPLNFPYGEQDEIPILAYEPNDFGLVGAQTGLDLINAKGAWDVTKGDPNVIIGIADSKIEVNHPDLQSQIIGIRGLNNSTGPNANHGTRVSGCAAASTDNGVGIAGIGFNSKILFSSNYNMGELLKMFQIQNVKVLNASWINCTYYKRDQDICDEIRENGVVLVASAGNKANGQRNCGSRWSYSYPASYNNVISVTSVGHINPIGYIDPIY